MAIPVGHKPLLLMQTEELQIQPDSGWSSSGQSQVPSSISFLKASRTRPHRMRRRQALKNFPVAEWHLEQSLLPVHSFATVIRVLHLGQLGSPHNFFCLQK
mmetsp:Transcript_13996/g.39552  ORF Transcript_13996/g.39552 Transcript_13996/m.39552 type:complete len:101 (-) Transcript_13996:1155-1457(-)